MLPFFLGRSLSRRDACDPLDMRFSESSMRTPHFLLGFAKSYRGVRALTLVCAMPGRFDRRELQSARPHTMSGAMQRPLMAPEGPMMVHSQMMQQQQHMMANGGLPGGHMTHLGPPQVPPYEMNPARPHFSPGHPYPVMQGESALKPYPLFSSCRSMLAKKSGPRCPAALWSLSCSMHYTNWRHACCCGYAQSFQCRRA